MKQRLVCFVPSDNPVGGIAKVLDYAIHGARHGVQTTFCLNNTISQLGESPLFKKPYFLKYGMEIELCLIDDLTPRPDDIVLFTLSSSHSILAGIYLGAFISQPNFIHLLQNVRVANTAFDGGYSYRLLPKPMHRIAITQEVHDAVVPLVEDHDLLSIIPHGFDFNAFARLPKRDDPIVIHFNTFKSNFGQRVMDAMDVDPEVIKVSKVQKGVSWEALQSAYLNSTVFLSTPLPEEGLYLPGLEAMAAGHAVIIPDAFGNRFYCDFDTNCCQVPYEDIQAYCSKLNWMIENWQEEVFEMRLKAHNAAANLGLDGEFERFGQKLDEVKESQFN